MSGVSPEGPDVKKPSGKCLVCGGDVKEKVEVWEASSRHSTSSGGLHCTRCGLKYEFMTPDGVAKI
ncbi:MAG: hypothetical protein BWY99_02420 [Synergistetes bacterium ADurb.BinA166]|nr:MAG: hypothetical protein BWY99_02420 [Synergistetes bacterium ADurb.BinA166]